MVRPVVEMSNTKVVITLIVSAMITVLALIIGLVYLAQAHADASTLLSLVGTIVSIVNTLYIANTRSAVSRLEVQTNGTHDKLIDAAIHATPPLERV